MLRGYHMPSLFVAKTTAWGILPASTAAARACSSSRATALAFSPVEPPCMFSADGSDLHPETQDRVQNRDHASLSPHYHAQVTRTRIVDILEHAWTATQADLPRHLASCRRSSCVNLVGNLVELLIVS
jgi:hypothetical protein